MSGEMSVLIVATNELAELRRCLSSVLSQEGCAIRLVVVDNASTDGTAEWLGERELPRCEVITLPQREGFCVCANVGLNAVSTEFVALVTPDVTLHQRYLAECLEGLEEGDVGIVGGKLLRSGPSGEPLDPPRIDTCGHTPRRDGNVIERGHNEIDHGQYDADCDVFGVTAAAIVMRREMLINIAIGGDIWAEPLWAYKDDIDVCWRAGKAGWRVVFRPAALAWHRRGFASVGMRPSRRRTIPQRVRFHSFANRYLVLIRNLRLRDLVLMLPWIFTTEVARFGYVLLFERAMLGAYKRALRLIPWALRTRGAIARTAVGDDPFRKFLR
jgi:GT2 family glycosyltransferase